MTDQKQPNSSKNLEPAAFDLPRLSSFDIREKDIRKPEDVADSLKDRAEPLFAGEDIADKLEEMTTAHGYVVKDEEAVKNLIQVLRSKTDER